MRRPPAPKSACRHPVCHGITAAADLAAVNLRDRRLYGADLRDARLEGANLSVALYLTQPQINAAWGSDRTRLAIGLSAPLHWYNDDAVGSTDSNVGECEPELG